MQTFCFNFVDWLGQIVGADAGNPLHNMSGIPRHLAARGLADCFSNAKQSATHTRLLI